MKKRQSSSRNQSSSPTSESSLSPSASPSPELHHHHHHHHHHSHSPQQNENDPFNCSKISSQIPENTLPDDNDSAADPQPSTIAEADRVEKMQLAKLHDRKPRIRYDPPSQCPCCGRITPASRHIA